MIKSKLLIPTLSSLGVVTVVSPSITIPLTQKISKYRDESKFNADEVVKLNQMLVRKEYDIMELTKEICSKQQTYSSTKYSCNLYRSNK